MKEGGENPSNPYVIPVTSRGCFGVGLCWDLGMLEAIIYTLQVSIMLAKTIKISYLQSFTAHLTLL